MMVTQVVGEAYLNHSSGCEHLVKCAFQAVGCKGLLIFLRFNHARLDCGALCEFEMYASSSLFLTHIFANPVSLCHTECARRGLCFVILTS